ncbi:CRISPR-associated endonuclease Cas3'' [Bifidobacterium sp. MA2]|uniref:CRISPR-associated endonuclease Cas3 n=1 Tax=Bifidobacterium santillanense TaxID=2809028 RepID=A0ABS5ULK2_9BIFI|nr:CRISPR-associated endonuclease Cas3'' [Bifidobacterium santillanense]MBT1171792.1 CRISPR-associated endonuclease Cas3'' [Bifidobacterium santillanense]
MKDDLHLSLQARSVWGKTDRQNGDYWLPLYVHMADSLAAAERIWDHWAPEGTKDIIRRDCGGEENARMVYAFLAGIHDIGKATPIFQSKPIRFDPNADPADNTLAWLPERAGLPVRTDFRRKNDPTHPVAGQVILEKHMTDRYGWDNDVARSYASVVGGHHGTPPPDSRALRDAALGEPARMGWDAASNGGDDGIGWQAVQTELVEYVMRMVGLTRLDMDRMSKRRLSPQTESLLTGLVIMADWIASNSDDDLFPLVPINGSLGDGPLEDGNGNDVRSWRGLTARAESAWRHLGLCSPWKAPTNDLGQLADPNALGAWFSSRFRLPQGASPRPVQREVARLAATVNEPGLMVIEAPMGEGKTEAALAAAEILAQRTGRGGVCIALPTMATTDAMFGRVHAWLDALPQPDDDIEKTIWLAHGKAQLNEEFRGVIAASRRALSSVDVDESVHAMESARRSVNRVPVESVVSNWMWGRKKGVLSNFLICTVDQVLMGSLQMKHVVLRQLALANKVVVIDECHAYDTYMQEYLKRILEWLGGFRAPVVLLSATLPESQRRDMVDAYMRGRSAAESVRSGADDDSAADGSPEEQSTLPAFMRKSSRFSGKRKRTPARGAHDVDQVQGYPLITYSAGETMMSQPLEPSGRSLDVSCRLRGDDDASLVELLDELLDGGGCVGVICSTVDRAQHAATLLRERYGDGVARLAHSRFVDLDRMDNERELRDLLGPHSTVGNGRRPSRLIVVGTQVLEQSLDVDFDALVTDIAPIDLVMQRLGRVHRHHRGADECDRPVRLRDAVCYVRGIASWTADGPEFDSGVKAVYEEASLMESLAVMGLTDGDSSRMLHLPEDIASMVRTAYGDAAAGLIPSAWLERYDAAVGKRALNGAEQKDKARSYLLCSLKDMADNEKTLTGWFDRHQIDDANDDKGQRAVRDTRETVEVMLLRGDDGEAVRLLPWIGDEHHGVDLGDAVPVHETPSDRLSMVMSQCSVRLPVRMNGSEGIDSLIATLEDGCGEETMMWQESPWLAGRLAVMLRDDGSGGLHAEINGFVVRYSREEGLVVTSADE